MPALEDGNRIAVTIPEEELDGDEEKISNEEIAELLSDAREEVQYTEGVVDEEDVITPLEPHDDEYDSDNETQIMTKMMFLIRTVGVLVVSVMPPFWYTRRK